MKRLNVILFCSFLFLCLSWKDLHSQDLKEISIYINPGHGGYDSDDRNVVIAPYSSNDPNGFWESQSNLDKGLALKKMLEDRGATVFMSRMTNTTADDLALTRIVALANESDADFMLAIHSNAGDIANMVLQLYAGKDPDDTYTYPSATPYSEKGREICTQIAINLYSNQTNVWGNNYSVRGDKTFARTAMKWSNGYGVLRGLTIPGAISEGSMHDYIPETYRLMNPDYKWLEAWHFLKSFTNYFTNQKIPTGNIVGTIHDSHFKNEAAYAKIPNSRDELLPLNAIKVTLTPGEVVYTTDNMNNGLFFFKDLLPGKYHIKVENADYYTQEADIEVTENTTSYKNLFLNKIRNTPPIILDFSPANDILTPVLCNTPIRIRFNWDIDENSAIDAFSIQPEVAGKITFEESSHVFVFTPFVYQPATVYSVHLAKTLKHPDNLCMENDFDSQFITDERPYLKILETSVGSENASVYYKEPFFEVIFDKQIQTSLANSCVNVYDSNNNLLPKIIRSQSNNKFSDTLGSISFKLQNSLTVGSIYRLHIDQDLTDKENIPVEKNMDYYFKAIDENLNDMNLWVDIHADGNIRYSLDHSTDLGSIDKNTSILVTGGNSLQLSYEFASSSPQKHEIAYLLANPIEGIINNSSIGLYVYGDLSNNLLNLLFENKKTKELQKRQFAKLDFHGWQYFTYQMNQTENESFDFIGLSIDSNPARCLKNKSEIYIDNITGEGLSTGITSVVNRDDNIIYPSVVTNYIYIRNNEKAISKVQIFNMNGLLLQTATGKCIDVRQLPKGTYLILVQLDEMKCVQRFIKN